MPEPFGTFRTKVHGEGRDYLEHRLDIPPPGLLFFSGSPTKSGMTRVLRTAMDWIPAYAGMTEDGDQVIRWKWRRFRGALPAPVRLLLRLRFCRQELRRRLGRRR